MRAVIRSYPLPHHDYKIYSKEPNLTKCCKISVELVTTATARCRYTRCTHQVLTVVYFLTESDTRTVPEDFLKTVELLIDYGADPDTEDRSGTKVFDLLANTFENVENSLSQLISKRLTAKLCDGEIPTSANIASYMLLNERGKVSLVERKNKRRTEGRKSDSKRQTDSPSDGKCQTDSSASSYRSTRDTKDIHSPDRSKKRKIQDSVVSKNDSLKPSSSKRQTDSDIDIKSQSGTKSENKPVILTNVAISNSAVLPVNTVVYPTALIVNNSNISQSERYATVDRPSNIILHKGRTSQTKKNSKMDNKTKFVKILPKGGGSVG